MTAVAAVGLGLRLYRITDESVWWDEMVCLMPLHLPDPVSYIRAVRDTDPAMTPLYFLVAYGWSRLVGTSILAMRMLSIALSMVTLGLVYRLGREMYGRQAGLIAALCFALAPNQIYFAQEIRVYVMVSALTVAGALTLRSYILSSDGRWLLLNLALSVALMWTHLFASFFVALEGLLLLAFVPWTRRVLWAWGGAVALSSVLMLFWISTMNEANIQAQLGWISAVTWPNLSAAFSSFVGSTICAYGTADPSPWLLHLMHIAVILSVLAAARLLWVEGVRSRTAPDPRRWVGVALLLGWWLVPVASMALLSWVLRPCFAPRYVVYSCIPAFIMMGAAAAGIARLRTRAAAGIGVIALFAAFAFDNAASRPMRADMANAAESILACSDAQVPVYFLRSTRLTEAAFRFYLETRGRSFQIFQDPSMLESVVLARRRAHQETCVLVGDTEAYFAPVLAENLGTRRFAFERRSFPSARGAVTVFRIPGAPRRPRTSRPRPGP